MKRAAYYIIAIAVIIVSLTIVFAKPAAVFIVKRQLKKAFPASAVTISRCDISPLKSIKFSDIRITKLPDYDIKCRQLAARFSLRSLKISLEGCEISSLSDKLKIKDLAFEARLNEGIGEFSMTAFGGSAKGAVKFSLDEIPRYAVDLQISDVDLDAFTKAFKLQEKARVTGKLNGNIFVQGAGARLEEVNGRLKAAEPGGTLTITDTEYLKRLPVKAGVSWQDLVKSFQDYNYNIGLMGLSLENNDLIFTVSLEGETGKRDLTIVLHDFKI